MIRILLADDYTIIRKGVRQILTQAYPHVQFEEIEEGEEWTEKLYASSWDMVISDLPMPDRGGRYYRAKDTYRCPGWKINEEFLII